MGKRTAFEANTKVAHGERDSKRQRTNGSHEDDTAHSNGIADEVHSARDLQNAIFFDQGSQGEFRNGK